MGLSPRQFGLLDAVGDWGLLATDAELAITGWNRWLERHTGMAAGDVVGQLLFDVFPDLPVRGLDRYFRQALSGQTAILSQRLHKYVLPIPPLGTDRDRMQQTGRIVPLVEDTAVCGTLTVIEDVTERVLREAELRSRSLQQAALAFSARSGLAGHDIADLCSESIRQLATTIGADLAEALELRSESGTWARLAGVGWRPETPAEFDTAETARTKAALRTDHPTVIGNPDGSGGPTPDTDLIANGATSGLIIRIPGSGPQPFGLLGVYTRVPRQFKPDEIQFVQALADIIGTAVERKRLETELRRKAAELADADRRKDEFLAMLAHELRNPLAPVRNAVQILRTTKADDPLVTRLTDMMGRQVGHMSHMVDDLLDVSRITRGRVTLRRERVALEDAVARSVETVRPLIEARRQNLAVSVPAEPIVLDADPTRLTQILGNLLNNAAKYTEESGHIWLTVTREGTEAVVRVRDTGIGLAADMIPRVFDLFAQAQPALDRAQGGLGIGLTLVRSLVELHGGSVSVTSPGPGRGSEFIVRFPALPTGAARAGAPEPGWPVAPAPRRFLIVDDNVDSADSLAELLSLMGHEARTAYDGTTALQQAQGWVPDVVLLDIGLPQMDGYEVAQRLRHLPGFRHITLIAMTGYGREEDRRRSSAAGFDHHLVKPIALDDIRHLLNRSPVTGS